MMRLLKLAALLLFLAPAISAQGVWYKVGPIMPPNATDYNSGSFFSGTSNGTVLYDVSCQIITPNADGKCFKMWFQGASNLFYAESNDAISWSRRATTVGANFGEPRIFKDSGTYYIYGTTPPTTFTGVVDAYTSSDGINFTLAASPALAHGTAGNFDDVSVGYLQPFTKIGAVWQAGYTGVHAGAVREGIATSTDLINWTNAATGFQPGGFTVAVTPTNYYAWGGIVDGDGGVSIGRSSSTDTGVTWVQGPETIPRSTFLEGVGLSTASIVPVVLQEAMGNVYAFYTGTNLETSGKNYLMMVAIAYNTTIAQLTLGNEGIAADPQNVLSNYHTFASDNFTRANETPLSQGGNWSIQTGSVQQNLVSNNAVATSTANSSRMIYSGLSWSADQTSSATIGSGFAATSFSGVNVHMAAGANTSYEFYVTSTGCNLRKLVAATQTLLYVAPCAPVAGDTLTISDINNVLKAYKNGVLVGIATDSAVVGGKPGTNIADTATASNAKFSSWRGGSTRIANVTPPSIQ